MMLSPRLHAKTASLRFARLSSTVLNLLKPAACQPSVALLVFSLLSCTSKLVPFASKKPPQLSLRGFVVSPRIELGSGASETLILSIVLRDRL